MNSKILGGIVPPLVTPLLSRDHLDVEGLENLIEHTLSGGVHGLFLLGTTGEGPSLSHRLRREVIELACRQVAGRVPIVVAVTDTSLPELLELAHFSAEQGAAGVVLAPPYYFGAGQAELIEFVEDVLAELHVPLVLYNMPALTKIKFDIATVRRLAQYDNIVGIKDSSGDMNYFHNLLRAARPGWSVMMGSETLMAEAVLFGADGGVCGGANVAPSLFVELFEAARNLNIEQVHTLQSRVIELGERLYSVGSYDSSGIKGIKGALACLNIGNGNTAEPFHSFGERERAQLRKALLDLQLLPITSALPAPLPLNGNNGNSR
ncbi:putative 2-dehydro-3-deoxy-D-pentonate aldolase YjhH [Abditibacteriota bacterium]|nr:putative 2-dehydro-3-deoxy-D-pentonate aldolase YjhH [Abditibacteriota bacterium]